MPTGLKVSEAHTIASYLVLSVSQRLPHHHPFLPALEDAEPVWAEEGKQFKKTSVVVQLPQVGARIPKHCSCREVPTLWTTWLE